MARVVMAARVILADDHAMVREGFKLLLERDNIRIVAEARDGREAVRLCQELQPDVAVLDLAMPLLNGIDAAREIRRQAPHTRTILLTVHAEDRNVIDALQAGIQGYVLKTQRAEELGQAIRDVASGALYLSPAVSRTVVDAWLAAKEAVPERVSPRERQVLQLVAEGHTTKEIAGILGVSVKTTESHRARIMRRLGIHTTAGLVRYAVREGLVSP